MSLLLKCTAFHGILLLIGCVWLVVIYSLWNDIELQESCVESWDKWICSVGNLSGLCSSIFWSFVLVPQIWHNYSRQSTSGLSLRWAFANVTAALINLNFILRVHVPLYMTITAIYMPVLELLILLQFALFSQSVLTRSLSVILFVVLIAITLGFIVFRNHISTEVSGAMMWSAVVLWSIETFPQLWLNARRRSTTGQAPETITISFLGKTTDFISMVSLNLPVQYRVMTYFSTCSAYSNVVQFLYYRNSHSPATLVSILIASCSFVMALKIGIPMTCVLVVSFLAVGFGGYFLEKSIFPLTAEEEHAMAFSREGEYDADDITSNLLPDDKN